MMQTVTFAKEFRRKIDDLREARYPVGEMTASNEIAEAARKAGVLEEKHGRGSSSSDGAGSNDQPEE